MVSDSGLKMLVDCCRKVLATAVGDGHDETVLYLDEEKGQYQIHTYSKTPGQPEYHRAYMTDEKAYLSVMDKIRENELAKLAGGRPNGLCGGEYVVKYVIEDKVTRVTTSEIPDKYFGKLYEIGSLLGSFIDTNKEIEEADEDLSSFAAGIKTEDEESGSDTEFVLNDEIEERCPAIYETKRADVKYGEFTHDAYYSETCQMERGYSILLPADYSEDKKYPVLYLLHGIFGDEYSFSNDGSNKIKEIAGNMAADGLIEETIVVCPNMFATSDPEQKPGFDSVSVLPYDNFINDLVNDLMPHIEGKYSVLTGRENTYLAGFSMGGRETIFITLKRPELFGYVCAISAAPGIVPAKDNFMTHEGQISESEMKFEDGATVPNVFIVCCGSRDSVVGTFPKQYHELLEANNAKHIWYEINGADHDNNAIKSGLFNLFKQIAFDKADT